MNTFLKTLLILVLLLLSLYVAVGGWMASNALVLTNPKVVITGPVTVDGHQFADAHAAEVYLKEAEVDRWFPWMRNPLPARFIACVGFALLGGAIGRLKRMVSGPSPELAMLLPQWAFSGAMGIVLYFLISVVSSGQNLFFMLVCLVGGLFSEETYGWLETKVKTILDMIFSKKS